MKNVKIAIFSILISVPAFSSDAIISKALEPWAPLEIVTPDNLTIVLNESRVTNEIYEAVITTGICMPLWLDGETDYLLKVDEIFVLNKFKAQGYVFEKPLETCRIIGDSNGKTGKVILMGNTHIF
jgi:hypothetical protein